MSRPAAAVVPESPYKGLAPFEDNDVDALLFFGRERESEIVASNLLASRLTVLYGPSGVGKSSVLRAGVAYRLRRAAEEAIQARGHPDISVVVFDDWRGQPAVALRSVVEDELGRVFGPYALPRIEAELPLADALRAWSEALDCELLLILDQFEEYFVYHPDEQGEGGFADELAELVTDSRLRVRVLLSLREDALAKLDRFKARIPHLFANYLRLDRLQPGPARAAVVGPLGRYNELVGAGAAAEIEPALVDAVIEETAAGRVDLGDTGRPARATIGGDGVETAYLQLVLARVWDEETRAGSRTLRLDTLRALGGAGEVVRTHVRRALDELQPGERDVAATIFNYLVTPSGTKIAHALSDLEKYSAAPPERVDSVVAALSRERVLRSVAAPGNGNGGSGGGYEIFHDVLADAVLAWRRRHEEERALERERVESSRRQRRLATLATGSIVAALVMAAVAVYALTQRREAERQTRVALARQLTASALAALDSDPERAMLLAVEAARTDASVAAENALRRALVLSRVRARIRREDAPPRRDRMRATAPLVTAIARGATVEVRRADGSALQLPVPAGSSVTALDMHSDGGVVVAASNGSVRLFDNRSIRWTELRGHDRTPVLDIRFSPDGTRVASAGLDGVARIWDASNGEVVATLVGHANFVTAVAFSSGGALLATASRDRTARVWEGRTGRPLGVLAGQHSASIVDLAYRPGGTRLLTWGADGSVREWDGGGDPASKPSAEGVEPHGRVAASRGTRAVAQENRVVLSLRGGRTVQLRAHLGEVTSVAFSRDGRFLLTASEDADARIWDASSGGHVKLLRGHFGRVADASFSPDGRWVVTAGPLAAGVWDAASGQLLYLVRGHRATLEAANWVGPNTIVTADRSGSVRIYRCVVCTGLTGLMRQAEQRRRLTGRVLRPAELR